jgi:hypothetical protein
VDFPEYSLPPPPVLVVHGLDSIGFAAGTQVTLGGLSSGTWATANAAYYYPFRLTGWATAYQLLFWVGATSSGNIDMGIYDAQKNRIVSAGSTAMSATVNTVQELNITDTTLAPGDYLLAVACDNTTATCFRAIPNDEIGLPQIVVYEQTGLTAAALPNPGVPVVLTDTTMSLVGCGIQFRSVF